VIVFESLTLLVRFLLELAMLGALGYWGFKTGDSALATWALGLGAPLAAAVVWGMFIAPKSTFEVPAPVWIGLQVVLFGAAAVALATVAPDQLAAIFLAVVVLDGAAMAVVGV